MSDPTGRRPVQADGVSLLDLAGILLRARWRIVALGLAGGLLGLASGLMSERMYKSSALFIPQGAESSTSGLALAASQFGVRIPSSGSGTWGPAVYVELLRSRSLLEQVATDTIVVAEDGQRRVRVMDLLEVEGDTPAETAENAYNALLGVIRPAEVKSIGAVSVEVTTPWPSVSLALAEKVVESINAFILDTRKSAAAAERQFVEAQAGEAGAALRRAEDRLQDFQQRNRIAAGPAQLERDRLAREVVRQEAIYASLLQSLEDAKIREVRDTPVITLLERPRLPFSGESRKTAMKAIMGGIAGGMLGVLLAFLGHWLAAARRGEERDSEFFRQVDALTPRFVRSRG